MTSIPPPKQCFLSLLTPCTPRIEETSTGSRGSARRHARVGGHRNRRGAPRRGRLRTVQTVGAAAHLSRTYRSVTRGFVTVRVCVCGEFTQSVCRHKQCNDSTA